MTNCVFCNIIARKLPAEILYENDDAISILDINPIHYGHSLVIPRRHCRDFLELTPESFAGVMAVTQRVSHAIVRSLNLEGFNIFSNNGAIAGQSVFHFHIHITPRYKDDHIKFVLELKRYNESEISHYANRIRRHLAEPVSPTMKESNP